MPHHTHSLGDTQILALLCVPRCTQQQPACTPLTHKGPVYTPVTQPAEENPGVRFGPQGKGQAWSPPPGGGCCLFSRWPPHLSPAGLFSSLSTGGEVPFEALQDWSPRGGECCDPGPRDVRLLAGVSQAEDWRGEPEVGKKSGGGFLHRHACCPMGVILSTWWNTRCCCPKACLVFLCLKPTNPGFHTPENQALGVCPDGQSS